MTLTEEEKDQKNREAILRVYGDALSKEEIERRVARLRQLRNMSSEEWQAKIEEENKAKEQSDYERFAARPKHDPISEEDFDNLIDAAEEKRRAALNVPRDPHWIVSSVSGYLEEEWTMAAHRTNPGETFRALFGHYPKLTGHYGHTPDYYHKEKYYVCKALACGIAETAEEAVQYFKDNK